MADRIRVALVITELDVGGAERCLVNLAVRLDPSRFEPVAYSLAPRPRAGQDALVGTLEEAKVPVSFLNATSAWQAFSTVRGLRTRLRQQQPRIVHSFLFHANVVAPLAARHLSGTSVITGVRVADPARWRQGLERLTSYWAARIVCVSRSVADFCQREAGLPKDKLTVIPNGIDTSSYPASPPRMPSELGIPEGRQIITCVARLHPQKGVDWLLSGSRLWLDRLPDHDLLIVGEGPQREELQRQAVSLGLAGRVHFSGWRPDVPQILAASAMLVLPSRWEGMPNAVLEAMASSLPVVAVRTHGVEELLGPLAERQSVPAGNQAAFAERMVLLADNVKLAADLGRRNRERVVQEFSLPTMVAAYERLYASLAQENAAHA